MPEKYEEWTLIKEYDDFGLYTNGIYRTCFSRFDIGLVPKRNKVDVRAEINLFNDSVRRKYEQIWNTNITHKHLPRR